MWMIRFVSQRRKAEITMTRVPPQDRLNPALLGIALLTVLILAMGGGAGTSEDAGEVQLHRASGGPRLHHLTIHKATEILPQSPDSVLPVIYKRPVSLKGLTTEQRKQSFINMMLPAVVVTHERLQRLARRIDRTIHPGPPGERDRQWLDSLSLFYEVEDDEALYRAVLPHPPSLALAQAALESGWGRSRFFREAGNAFGVWAGSSSKNKIASNGKRNGKPVYLRSYKHLLEAVEDYYQVLAQGPYASFRKARARGEGSLKLALLLVNYSEKGAEYGRSLSAMIRHNKLQRFDTSHLVMDWEAGPVAVNRSR